MIRCSATGMIDRLEDERDRRGDIEMRRALDIGLPGDRQRKNDGLQREHVEKRIEAVLVEQHEADQHEAAGEQMGEVEGETFHHRLAETKRSNTGEEAEHEGDSDEIGDAKDAHLGDCRFEQGEQHSRRPRACRHRRGRRSPARAKPLPSMSDPPRREHAGDQGNVEQQLEPGRQFDQREMPSRIFQHHRLVHHRELQMRRRIVHGNAAVLGDRDNDQRDERHARATRAGRRRAKS